MRFLISTFFLTFSLSTFCQLSVSVGANRKLEDVQKGGFFKPSENSRFLNDSYCFNLDWHIEPKNKLQWRLSGALSYLKKSITTGKERASYFLNGDSTQGWYSRGYHVDQFAKHDYSYLGAKLGAYIVFTHGGFSHSAGLLFELDFLIRENESNHLTTTEIVTDWTNGSTSTEVLENHNAFDDRKLNETPFNFGIVYRPRYTYSNFFIELNLAFGVNFFRRRMEMNSVDDANLVGVMSSTYDHEFPNKTGIDYGYEEQTLNASVFFESGIKLGYYIDWKKSSKD